MARPVLPTDGERPYGDKLRTALYDVSDRADIGIANAAYALARANHTGTQTADSIVDGTTNKAFTATEKTKLAGIATAATANDTDANLKNRANHTGTQLANTISDFTNSAKDVAGALIVAGAAAGTGVTATYDNTAHTLSLTAAGGGGSVNTQQVKDIISTTITGTGVISSTPIGSPVTSVRISSTATVNDTDANLKNRANHTGTQTADTIVDGATNKVYTATEKTKLAGISSFATSNSSDATLLSRANHTGAQLASTISDFSTAVAASTTGKENAITAGTTSQYWRGDKSWQTLDKTAVGLSNVDNTADTAKPVSTAQQTALNLKANLASPALTGAPTAPTATTGTNTTQVATTAFVNSSTAGYTPLASGGQAMRITGYGTVLPSSGAQTGDIFFLQG